MVSAHTAAVYGLVAAQTVMGAVGHLLGAAGHLQGTGGAIVLWALAAAIAYMASAMTIRIGALGLMGLAEGVIFAAGIPRARWTVATGALAGVTATGLALGAYMSRGGVIPWWMGLPAMGLVGGAMAYVRYWPTETSQGPTQRGQRWAVVMGSGGVFFYETVRVAVASQAPPTSVASAHRTDAVQSAVRLSATGLLFSWAVGAV